MALVYGSSTKGKRTLIHHNFEYLKEKQYINGRISWRCRMYKRFKCKARLVTSDDQVVCEPQLEHTHSGNDATSLARKAIGEMKECISNFTSTPSSSQAAVKERLEDHVLMALPIRSTLNRTLQRHRIKGSDILCLRLLITSILLTISCSAKQEGNATGSSADIDQLWEDFKVDFAKFYGSESEEEMRKQIFMENLNKTQTLNDLYAKGQSTFTAGINQFHDMKQSEFGAKTTCILDPLFSFKNATTYSDNSTKFPRNIDWSEKGYVTPVKDQGLCRACWAFVTTGALEALNFGNTGRLVSLSEQQLIDCSREYGNKGCNGGGTRGSFFYLTDNGGINSEASYPYEGIDGTCRYQPNATAATCHGSASARGEIKLKAIVANVGPAASAIFISESLRMYNGGIYDDDNCTGNPGHAVLVVGYGTDPKTKKDYWRIKNSFGTTWGMDGYALIARNKEMCGIGFNLRYPFLISDECHSGETSREDS